MDDVETRLMAEHILGDFLSRQRKSESSILPEAKIARLKEAAARFTDDNPFKVGDVVTIRQDAPMKGEGEPHLVIESGSTNLGTAVPDEGNWTDGGIRNVRVLMLKDDLIMPYVLPHWALEHYQG